MTEDECHRGCQESYVNEVRGADNGVAPKGCEMTRLLFLLSPMIFTGIFLLVGETLSWLKKRREVGDHTQVRFLSRMGGK